MLENYKKNELGVIKQVNIKNKIVDYNIEYVDNSYNNYGESVSNMSHLRLGYLLGVLGDNFKINNILDVGYGNGDFLKTCLKSIPNCYGNDISNYPLPDGCTFVGDIMSNKFDVICFFDCLEHIHDINFVSELNTEYVYISLPWCHYHSDEWFNDWKHRREDEHIWHFNEDSLIKFMDFCGFDVVITSNIEDIIRTPINNDLNILTGIFKKRSVLI